MVLLLACRIMRKYLPHDRLKCLCIYAPCQYMSQKTGAVFKSYNWSGWKQFVVFLSLKETKDCRAIPYCFHGYRWVYVWFSVSLNQSLMMS